MPAEPETTLPALAGRAAAPGGRVSAYLRCIRLDDVVVLQGSPVLGALFAMHPVGAGAIGRLALLTAASFLLVTHVFALNDWAEVRLGQRSARGPSAVARAAPTRRELGRLAMISLSASLLLFTPFGPRTLGLGVAIAALSAVYSVPALHAKGVPLLNSALHLAGGLLLFLLGYSVFAPIDRRGLEIGCFFALTFVAGHLTQEVRDHDEDLRSGIRTNAAAFGKRATFAAGLALFTAAEALLVILAASGRVPRVLIFAAALYPLHLYWSVRALASGLTRDGIRRLQRNYRGLYAGLGLLIVLAALLGH